jgi:PD-(D/E)XK nuclease superfamily protein
MSDPSLFDELGDRQCRRCGTTMSLAEFSASLRPNGTVKFGSYCPPCRKAYQHEWYLANREQALARSAARREAEKAQRPPKPAPVERRPLREAIGFRKFANPRKQGNAGLGIAIAYLSRIGVEVAIPLTDTQRYDLIIVHDQGMERVQVKTTTLKVGKTYVVHLRTVGGNKSQVKTRPFDPADYEWLFVVCGDATAYMIPTTEITARQSLSLGARYERFRLED